MEKDLKVAIMLIGLCIVGLIVILVLTVPSKRTVEEVKKNHWYDYIIEVDGEDSIPKYDIFDNDHNLIATGLKSTQIDSVIIKDNE